MVDKEFIRKKHLVEGWSIREISRILRTSRQTIRKMLQDAEVPKYKVNSPQGCSGEAPLLCWIGDEFSVKCVKAD